MLTKNSLVPKIHVLSDFLISALCCFLRIGTFLDLRFNILTVDLMLCWHFSKEALQEEEVLAKAAVKLRVEIFCLA